MASGSETAVLILLLLFVFMGFGIAIWWVTSGSNNTNTTTNQNTSTVTTPTQTTSSGSTNTGVGPLTIGSYYILTTLDASTSIASECSSCVWNNATSDWTKSLGTRDSITYGPKPSGLTASNYWKVEDSGDGKSIVLQSGGGYMSSCTTSGATCTGDTGSDGFVHIVTLAYDKTKAVKLSASGTLTATVFKVVSPTSVGTYMAHCSGCGYVDSTHSVDTIGFHGTDPTQNWVQWICTKVIVS